MKNRAETAPLQLSATKIEEISPQANSLHSAYSINTHGTISQIPTKTSPLPPLPDTVPVQRPDIKFETLTIHGNESTITVFLGFITIRTIPCQPRTAHGRRRNQDPRSCFFNGRDKGPNNY